VHRRQGLERNDNATRPRVSPLTLQRFERTGGPPRRRRIARHGTEGSLPADASVGSKSRLAVFPRDAP
jgi:hypothetical protein